MHEVVTLQLGEQANYVGTHFWNIQESYFTYSSLEESPIDHDRHFKGGVGADGSDTYTPRTLIYDFKTRFGTLRRINELYDVADQEEPGPQTWGSRPALTHRQPPLQPHPYQQALNNGTEPPQLEAGSIRFWSDYNRVFYHPRSIAQVYETELNPDQAGFDTWSAGNDLFGNMSRGKDLVDDDFRPLVEECDQMQGIQVLTSVDDGWGGFASRYLDALRDDYGKSSIWIWALNGSNEGSLARRRLSMSNQALSLYELSSQASVYLPVTSQPFRIPHSLSVDRTSAWSTSALQAMAIESMLLPTRLKRMPGHDHCSMEDMVVSMGEDEAQRVAQLSVVAEPVGIGAVNGVANGEEANRADDVCELLPHETVERHRFAFASTVRAMTMKEDVESGRTTDRSLHLQTPLAFPMLDSFPGLFKTGKARAREAGVCATAAKTGTIASWTDSLQAVAQRNVSLEDREAVLDGLKQISSAYRAGADVELSEEEFDTDD